MNRNLKYIEYEPYKSGSQWLGLTAWHVGYGFKLEIVDIDTEEVLFSKFLRTQDTSYCGNYLRKVVRNNFGAERA